MRLALILAAFTLCACSDDVTQLVVAVGAEHDVREIGCVTVRSSPQQRTNAGDVDHRRVFCVSGDSARCEGRTTIPFSFAVVPSPGNEDGPARLEIHAAIGDCDAPDHEIEMRVATRFLSGRVLRVPVYLSRSCEDYACGEEETCDRGACIPAYVDPGALPPLRRGEELRGLDAGAPRDTGTTDASDTGIDASDTGIDAEGDAASDAEDDARPDSGLGPLPSECTLDLPELIEATADHFDVSYSEGAYVLGWRSAEDGVVRIRNLDSAGPDTTLAVADSLAVATRAFEWAVAYATVGSGSRTLHYQTSLSVAGSTLLSTHSITSFAADEIAISPRGLGYAIAVRVEAGVDVFETAASSIALTATWPVPASHPRLCEAGSDILGAWNDSASSYQAHLYTADIGGEGPAAFGSALSPVSLATAGRGCWLATIENGGPTIVIASANAADGEVTLRGTLAPPIAPRTVATAGTSRTVGIAYADGFALELAVLDQGGTVLAPPASASISDIQQLDVVALSEREYAIFFRKSSDGVYRVAARCVP